MFRRICSIVTLCMVVLSAYGMPESYKKCVSCHGTDGNTVVKQWPKIAGQSTNYFIKQMQDFQKGQTGPRNNPIMMTITTKLTPAEIVELADYCSQQSITINGANPNLIKLGEDIYRGGIRERKVPACASCHGPNGMGNSLAKYPRISGQNAEYLAIQLALFKEEKRTNDPNQMMRDIAKRLTPDEINAVANYVSGLY